MIPTPILKFVQYIPTKDHIRFRRTLKVINQFAKTLIDEKTDGKFAGVVDKAQDAAKDAAKKALADGTDESAQA